MLLRRSLVCREGRGAPVAYGIHISGNAYQDLGADAILQTVLATRGGHSQCYTVLVFGHII
jgi:hypothetical protein